MNALSVQILSSRLLNKRILKSSMGDEDTAQAVRLRLLELAHAEPWFAKQTTGYHVKRAAWEARHAREKVTIYNRYVCHEPLVWDPMDGEQISAFDEYIPGDDLTPEQIVEQRQTLAEVQAAINSLPDSQRRLMGLLAMGFTQMEICQRTGMSKSSVSHMVSRARRGIQKSLAL